MGLVDRLSVGYDHGLEDSRALGAYRRDWAISFNDRTSLAYLGMKRPEFSQPSEFVERVGYETCRFLYGAFLVS